MNKHEVYDDAILYYKIKDIVCGACRGTDSACVNVICAGSIFKILNEIKKVKGEKECGQ